MNHNIFLVLLFTNLDPLTVEDTVWQTAQGFSKQPVKNISIPRDKLTNMSRYDIAHKYVKLSCSSQISQGMM